MTPSEFGFLAVGLVLGVATGAALLEVLRARPRPRPEVRLTITHDAIAPRAGTAAAPPRRLAPGEDRRAGADRRSGGDRRFSGERRQGAVPGGPRRGWEFASDRLVSGQVAVPVAREPDPHLTALRGLSPGPPAGPASATPIGAPAEPARHPTVVLAGHRPARAGEMPSPTGDLGAAAPPDAPHQTARSGSGASGTTSASSSGRVGLAAMPPAVGIEDVTCAAERRIVEERCALAERLREAAEAAQAGLRAAQRAYDESSARIDQARAASDPRAVAMAKNQAQQTFRLRRGEASSRHELEAIASDWLQEINRINLALRDGVRTLQVEEHRALELLTRLEEVRLGADAARISAETAQQACLAARETLAACQEQAARGAAAAETVAPPLARTPSPPLPAGPFASGPVVEEAAEIVDASEPPAIFRLLRGDRAAFERIVRAVAGDDAEEQRRWQLRLSDLVDVIVAVAKEASVFDFPEDHPFWGQFSQGQAREIAVALSSLGYRHDGRGGIADERLPSTRDLSMAIGYAGLDAMRIRRWPNETQMAELFREVRVAADEYLATEAGDLTLGQMVTLLGPRSDALTDVWNEWGRLRPLLLAPVPSA